MTKKIWLGLAALSISALAPETALGATITLNSTCTFAEAVGWMNTPTSATSKDGCTRSGSFGSNDTIIVGLDGQVFTIGNTVEIKKSMTIQSWFFYSTLRTTSTSTPIAIKIVAPDIVVQFNAIRLEGVANNTTTGIHVDGTDDYPLGIDAFKVIMNDCNISGFRRSGMYLNNGSVQMVRTFLGDNSNMSSFSQGGGRGGAVRIESTTKPAKLLFQDGWVVGNRARRGGAIYNHGVLQFTNSFFSNNVATMPFVGGGTGAVVFAEYNPINYYTAFAGGGHFENNQADSGGYSLVAGARAEFSGTDIPFTATGNSLPLCEDAFGTFGCPTQ